MANKNHSIRSRFKYLLTAIAVLCCTAIGVAYAAGNGVNASGSVSAANLSVGLKQMNPFTFKNEVPVIAQPIVVTNNTQTSSQQRAQMEVEFIGDGDSPRLVEETQLWIWPIENWETCDTSTAIPSGTTPTNLATGATFTAQLARAQAQTYCVRMEANIQNLYSSTGTISGIALKTMASLTLGNFTTSTSNSSNISTYSMYTYIVPQNAYYQLVALSSKLCLDVSGGTNAKPNAPVGTYNCYTSTEPLYGNQWFRFKDPNGNNGTYSTMQPRIPVGTGIQAGTTNGSGLIAASINTSLKTQQWVTQIVDPTQNIYQIVSRETGLCLTASPGVANSVLAPCANISTQRFTFKTVNVPAPTSEIDATTDNEEKIQVPHFDHQNQSESGVNTDVDSQKGVDINTNNQNGNDSVNDNVGEDKSDGGGSGSEFEEDLDNSHGVEGAENE